MNNPESGNRTPERAGQNGEFAYRGNNSMLNVKARNAAIYDLYDGESNDEELEHYQQHTKRGTVHRHQHRANGFERFVYFIFHALFIAVCFTVILLVFVFKIMVVNGNSMSPAVKDGDYIAVNRLDKIPAQGDITVIYNKSEDSSPTVKRIVASENQVVNLNREKNIIYVNGVPFFSEFYKDFDIDAIGDISYPIKVPEGCYFVLGDNLSNSLDSRSASVGMIPKENIMGTVIADYRPGYGMCVYALDDAPAETSVKDKKDGFLNGLNDIIDNIRKTI